MSINTRHALHPLALAVTLALAACGGNQDTPQTSAPGPQTKADTGLPATVAEEGKPAADAPAALELSAVAQRLTHRSRGLAGKSLGVTPA